MLPNLNRPLPSDLLLEKKLLGQIFVDNSIFAEVNTLINANNFYSDKHKKIYTAMGVLNGQDAPIDPVNVAALLKNDIGVIGGISYLVEISTSEISAGGFRYTVKKVKELYVRRCSIVELLQLASEMLDTGTELNKNIEKISDLSNSTLKRVGLGDNAKSMQDLLKEAEKELLENIANGGKVKGRLCGIKDLDNTLGGFENELIVIGARPSCGKTTLCINILRGLAVNYNCLFFSMEQKGTQLINKLLSQDTCINAYKIDRGALDGLEQDKVFNSFKNLGNLKLYIDERCGIGISEIENAIMKASQTKGVDVVCIDYLQYMEYDGDDANKAFGKIVKRLKNITKKYGVCIILLSQLSRKSEDRADKRPVMSDLRDSGSIEQEADKICLLHREERYDKDTELKGIIEVNLTKNRNGATDQIMLNFDLDKQLITSVVAKDLINKKNTVKSINKPTKAGMQMLEVAHEEIRFDDI